MFIADGWRDYAVLDTGDGHKLERWGGVVLRRPDPQVIWPKSSPGLWTNADATYTRSDSGGGGWAFSRELPEKWSVRYGGLSFIVRPTGFKHTGLFPEQAANWDFISERVRRAAARPAVLNLFGYTGGATLACCSAGAEVTHVDAAKGMVQWGKDNQAASGLTDKPIRWIVDDALKFVAREARRGRKYDGILMDPPSYGRGPDGQVWKLERELYGLVETSAALLSDKPVFFIINAYTTGLQPAVLRQLLLMCVGRARGGVIDAREIVLPVETGGVLPCGATGRWTPD